MRREAADTYRCPQTGSALRLEVEKDDAGGVVRGRLIPESGTPYPIRDGVPHFLAADAAPAEDGPDSQAQYRTQSDAYDAGMDWLFGSFYADEAEVRAALVDVLELQPAHRVLETGCGTCSDSLVILRRLGEDGALYAQDLSPEMLRIGRDKIAQAGTVRAPVEFSVGDATSLPFADGFFDVAYHFGGINLFADRARAIAEMTRVVRTGGKVVFGDEGVAPWLRDEPIGRILINSNPLYRHTPPLACLPPNAREVRLRWILGNAFYVIDYRVGDGPPPVDLDLPIPGVRGGTHRTRFSGTLDGVTPDTKTLAERAAQQRGMSRHAWLERTVRERAQGDLGE